MSTVEHKNQDRSAELLEQVQQALATKTPLRLQGGNTKAFLGKAVQGQALSLAGHEGVVDYDPAELVVTVRAGTSLQALEKVLNEQGQCLPFEPPLFDGRATVGGATACGLSGPRRPWVGSLRDYVLGCRLISGMGTHMRFGGQVMKNVAGYDVSRLMVGAQGALGVITEVSFKVLPRPRSRVSLVLDVAQQDMAGLLRGWRDQSRPITGAAWQDGRLHLRLEGGDSSVQLAQEQIGGEALDLSYWDDLCEQRLEFFRQPGTLWRIALPVDAPVQTWPGQILVDWGGTQLWLKSDAPAEQIHEQAQTMKGHARCWSGSGAGQDILPESLLIWHQRLKQQLDPVGIFNPGRLFPSLESTCKHN
ncbi:glycolate oxidase subunit GlcE [Alcaligenes aquatilis]|uniref:glycolate oxidase subunit GlcE n=1 Tax=Alcaligenes aquatilis TaxID=323284 RepID=UPI000F65F5D4|nr:glycolate oxidase subunit GlcE [Alcaligenes aquatilis]QXR37054.1 glycolate oxidase subunit GlcE [Alcaligenes aquatilis]